LESIFDKFVQSSKNKTSTNGTGLGLPICQEIIAAHKGRIWAENNPEIGANLSFEIPLSLEANEQEKVLVGSES
jgi:K+-sensing histidine kinase KdpD